MLYDPLRAHQVEQERIKDAFREVERCRLTRGAASTPGRLQGWRRSVTQALRSLLALARPSEPQSQRTAPLASGGRIKPDPLQMLAQPV